MTVLVRGVAPTLLAGVLTLGFAFIGHAAMADDPHLAIKNHRFQPERIVVPAGVKFRLMVRNDDDSAEEFESSELNREKIVPAGREIPVFLGPLDKGEYKFFGDFHQDTAQGVMVAQ